MAADRTKIRIKPMKAIWGLDVMQVQTITISSVASINNKYFFFYDSAGTKHYAWFNVNSTGADPAPSGGGTAHEVALDATPTVAEATVALSAVLGAVTGFDSTSTSTTVVLTHTVAGYAQLAHDGDSGFSFAMTTEGNTALDVGYTDGDIEIKAAEDKVDVVSHQTGSEVLSHIRTGDKCEVTINFKETSIAQLRKLFLKPGGEHTPTGTSGTQLFGYGQGRQFTQTYSQANRLRLHPVALTDTDYSEDVTFWLAYPQFESIKHSGENILMVPVTFTVYRDTSKPDAINKFAIGDATGQASLAS